VEEDWMDGFIMESRQDVCFNSLSDEEKRAERREPVRHQSRTASVGSDRESVT
jgi:hypothetical protein